MRQIATVLFATAMATCIGHAAVAQAQQPTPAAPATPTAPATPSAQEKSANPAATTREQKREQRKAARQAKRKDCVTQARAKKLKGDDRRSFMKTCVKS